MQIILLKDVDNLGYSNDVVKVKNGYARNFLIPQGMAVIANDTNLRIANERKKRIANSIEKRLSEFKEVEAKLAAIVIKVGAKAGTSGKIFGSVTNIQIANAVKEQAGVDIERKYITIDEDVKNIGSYTATANLHPEVKAKINFEVIAE